MTQEQHLLSNLEIERYSRQLIIPEFNLDGNRQAATKAKKEI